MSTNYIPARLVRAKDRWYIVYYQFNPKSEQRERFRETFDLNRISDIGERLKKADLVVKQINARLPFGYPFEKELVEFTPTTNILRALSLAKRIKCNTDRKRTIDMVESICKIFTEYLVKRNLTHLEISSFKRRHVLDFLDYALFERKVGNRTHNNYVERMRSLFNELKDREYIKENPFAGIRKKKVMGKTRRAFNEEERKIVATTIAKTDRWLMLGVLLQYHCFIRPIEQRRLRFHMINLREGIIRMPGRITKNRENSVVTIPDVLLPFLRNFGLNQYNQRWLIFGEKVQPHPSKCCSHNTMNHRHKMILKKLYKKGLITDLKGLTFYSWKDTGAMELFKQKVNPLEIMRQLRHKDLATTQLYCQSLYMINEEIKALNNPLIVEEEEGSIPI